MSKMNNKKKSVGIALTGFLVLGGISQSHVYAFENKNDSSIELHKQAYLSPNYLKKQLNNFSASLNIENDLNKNKYITLEDYSRKILTANSRNSLNKDNTSSEKLTTIKLEKNIDQTNIKTKKNQKHNTGDIEKESVKSSTTEPEEKPVKSVQKEVSTDKDGIYIADIKTLKEKSDETSMSGTYIEEKAKYTKQNGKVYCEINVLAIDWMKNIKILLNGKEVNPTITRTGKTNVMGMDHEGATLKFEVDKVNPELIFKMYVEPMSSNVAFRVVGEKLKFEALKDTKPTNKEDKEKDKTKPSTTKPEEKPVKPVQKEVSTDKDGIYIADIKTLKEKSDETSMSGTYIEEKAKYTKQNGKVYCEINVLAIDWMKNIKILLNGKEVNPTITRTDKTNVMGMDHEGATLKFEVDKVNPELTFKMYVEPMHCDVTFRVVGEKLKFEALKDTKPTNKEDKEKDKTKPSTTKPEEKPAKPVQKEVSTDKDGIYEAEIKTLKEKSDETSMSGTYFEKKVKYTKQNGRVYCEINVLAIDWMKNIKVFLNSKEVNPTITKTGKTKVMGMDHEGATLKFEVDKVNPELTFKMYVEPMHCDVTFRVVGEKLKFEALKDTKPANKEDKEKDKTKPSTTKPEEKPDVKQDKDKQKDNQNKPKESENKPSEKPIEKPVQKSEVTKSINIVALKENSNEQSMAGDYLNGTVQYTEKDGKKFFTLTVTRIDWMKNIDVSVDGANVPYDKKELGQIAELTFEVNSENSEVTMHMNVVPMGNSRVAFRVLNENNVSVEKPDVKPTEPKNNENKDNEDKPKESQKEDKQKEQPQTKINKEILKIVKFKNLKKGSYNNVKTLVSCDNKKHEKLLKENLDIKTDIKITEEKDVMVTILLKGKYANVTNILVDGKSVISSEVSKNRKGLLAPEGIVINNIVEEKLNESKVVQFKLPNINSKIELVTEDSKIPNEQIKANIDIKNDLVSKSLDRTTLPKEIVNKDLDNQSSSQSSKQIKDGMYNVSIKTLKESSDEPSMAGGYIEKVNYEVKDGKQFILLKLNRLDWMTNITATVDGKTITPTIIERTKNDKGEEKGIVKFEVSSPESKIKLTMNVEPMGNARVSFRVIPEVNSLKLIDQNDAKDQEQKSNEKPLDQNEQVKSDNKDKEKPKESEKKPSGRQDNKEKHSFYEIKVDTLKEKDNSPSMAGEYIKASNYEIKGDKKYLILTLNRTDWMTNIKAIVDGKEITPTIVESFKNSKGEETSRIKFEIPSLESPIKLSMNVEPMGNSRVTFRVVPNKNSLKPINNLNSITNAPAKKTNLDPNSKKKELEPIEETIINSGKEESNNKKNSLPKTGLPINTGILATLGTILSGLGISLKKFKK